MALISYRISAEGTVAEARRRNAAASTGNALADLEERIVVDTLLRMRAKDHSERQEEEAILELYMQALGMV